MDIRTKLLTYTGVKPNDEDAAGTKGNAKFQYGWAYLPTTKNLFNQIRTFFVCFVFESHQIICVRTK